MRLFPYSGFIQSQVLAITQIANELTGDLVRIELGLHPATVELLNGSVGGNYWNFKAGAASAWQVKDVTQYVEASPEIMQNISASAIDIPISGAQVSITTTTGTKTLRIEVAPGNDFGSHNEQGWRIAKWKRLVGNDYIAAEEFARSLMSDCADTKAISALQTFLLS